MRLPLVAAVACLVFCSAAQAGMPPIMPDTPESYRKQGEAESQVPGRELRAVCWFAAYLAAVPGAADAADLRTRINLLQRTSHDNLRRLVQRADDAAHQVAATERAHGVVETSLDTLVVLWDEFGDFNKATEVAGSIKDAYERWGAYARVSGAQIEAGDFAGARGSMADQLKAIEDIAGSYWGGEAMVGWTLQKARLAEAQAKTGDLAGAQKSIGEALAAAPGLANNYRRSKAYRAIAIVQTVAGDADGAERTLKLIESEDALVAHECDVDVALAEARLQAGDWANARKALAAAVERAREIKPGATQRTVDLEAAVAESERADARPRDVYRAIGLAQVHAADWEGMQRTIECAAPGERLPLQQDIARATGTAVFSPEPITAQSWLGVIYGSGWRMSRGLEQPLFTDGAWFIEVNLAGCQTAEQTFAALERDLGTVQRSYDEVARMLKEQFKR